MNRTVTRTGSALATAALVVASLAIASPAHAATVYVDSITDGPETDATYLGWHQGQATAPAVTFQPDGLLFGDTGPSQVLNGLVAGGTNGLATTNADLLALITSMTVEVVSGQLSLQVPITADDGYAAPTSNGAWATLRPAALVGPGSHTPAASDLWLLSRTMPDIGNGALDNTPMPLSDLLEALENHGDQLRYSGFGVWAGTATVLESITWGGDTYVFAAPPAAPAPGIPPTGFDAAVPLALGALVLLALGAGLFVLARRRAA